MPTNFLCESERIKAAEIPQTVAVRVLEESQAIGITPRKVQELEYTGGVGLCPTARRKPGVVRPDKNGGQIVG